MSRPTKMNVTAKPENFQKQHQDDAGFDLRLQQDVTLLPGVPTLAETGVKVAIPTNCVGLVVVRSSIGKRGITLGNAVGVIDSGYRGEILLNLLSHKEKQTLFAGERVAQLLVVQLKPVNVAYVDQLENSERGEGGFGSTGKH